MDSTRFLTRDEVRIVLDDLHRRSKRSVNSLLNLVIFRLSCCCGLRCKEIRGLDLGDVVTVGARPCIRIRKAITKGREGERRGRIVPLWWDEGTRADLERWIRERPESASTAFAAVKKRLGRSSAARRWATAIRALGPERVRQLSIHCGRHSFCSHALHAGRSLVEVRDAAGHRNINTTSIYLHSLERSGVPDVFSFGKE